MARQGHCQAAFRSLGCRVCALVSPSVSEPRSPCCSPSEASRTPTTRAGPVRAGPDIEKLDSGLQMLAGAAAKGDEVDAETGVARDAVTLVSGARVDDGRAGARRRLPRRARAPARRPALRVRGHGGRSPRPAPPQRVVAGWLPAGCAGRRHRPSPGCARCAAYRPQTQRRGHRALAGRRGAQRTRGPGAGRHRGWGQGRGDLGLDQPGRRRGPGRSVRASGEPARSGQLATGR